MIKFFKKVSKFFSPLLEADNYAGIVTVFAVITAIEYADGSTDVWDIFIAFISIMLGIAYSKNTNCKLDFWYSFLASSLISLGLVTLYSFALFSFAKTNEWLKQLIQFDLFSLDLARFFVFLVISLLFTELRDNHLGVIVFIKKQSKKLYNRVKQIQFQIKNITRKLTRT